MAAAVVCMYGEGGIVPEMKSWTLPVQQTATSMTNTPEKLNMVTHVTKLRRHVLRYCSKVHAERCFMELYVFLWSMEDTKKSLDARGARYEEKIYWIYMKIWLLIHFLFNFYSIGLFLAFLIYLRTNWHFSFHNPFSINYWNWNARLLLGSTVECSENRKRKK